MDKVEKFQEIAEALKLEIEKEMDGYDLSINIKGLAKDFTILVDREKEPTFTIGFWKHHNSSYWEPPDAELIIVEEMDCPWKAMKKILDMNTDAMLENVAIDIGKYIK